MKQCQKYQVIQINIIESEHTVVLSLRFLSIIVTKILSKIVRPLLRRNYGKLVRGSAWDEQCRFQIVLVVALSFTRSLPTRIQWLAQHKPLNLCFETAIGDFSC